jgi:hypothetical protein
MALPVVMIVVWALITVLGYFVERDRTSGPGFAFWGPLIVLNMWVVAFVVAT